MEPWYEEKKKLELRALSEVSDGQAGKQTALCTTWLFAAFSHNKPPLDVKRRRGEKSLNRYLISSCAIWKRRTRFIFHFYRDRRSRRTVKAVSYSSGSETRARGGEKKWHFSNIFCLLRTGSGAFTITICPVRARNAVAIRFYGIHFSVSARVTR